MTSWGNSGEGAYCNAECGMWNAELKWKVARRTTLPLLFRIPHSAFRIVYLPFAGP